VKIEPTVHKTQQKQTDLVLMYITNWQSFVRILILIRKPGLLTINLGFPKKWLLKTRFVGRLT